MGDKEPRRGGLIPNDPKRPMFTLLSAYLAGNHAYEDLKRGDIVNAITQAGSCAGLLYEAGYGMLTGEYDGRGFRFAIGSATLSSGMRSFDLVSNGEMTGSNMTDALYRPVEPLAPYILAGRPRKKKPVMKMIKEKFTDMVYSGRGTPVPTRSEWSTERPSDRDLAIIEV